MTSMIFGSSRRGHYFYDPAYDFKSKMDISSQKCPFKGLTANGFTICNNHGPSYGKEVIKGYATPHILCPSYGVNAGFYRETIGYKVIPENALMLTVASICTKPISLNVFKPNDECPKGGLLINGKAFCNGLRGLNGKYDFLVSGSAHQDGGGTCRGFDINGKPLCLGYSSYTNLSVEEPSKKNKCKNNALLANEQKLLCDEEIDRTNIIPYDSIVAVKLCPEDDTPKAEYGFIIGGELYGVLYNDDQRQVWNPIGYRTSKSHSTHAAQSRKNNYRQR